MKKIYSLLLLTTIFCGVTLATETPTTKKKPIIITDYDDVWQNKTFFLNSLAQLQPLETLFKSKKPSTQPYSAEATKGRPAEQKVRKFGNLPLRLLDYGRRYPTFASSIPGLINYIGKARCINQPIHNLYKHLKQEGYPLIIATNKDHLLYDLSLEILGNEIPNMVDKVFVAEPESNKEAIAQLQTFADKPKTPMNYKNMLNKALSLHTTDSIIQVPSKKPAPEFFTFMVEKIGPDNDMIFIDDKQENVDAFNALQKDSSYIRRSIVYDQSNPQQFTQELIKLGVVSEMNDKKLLDDIRYPGVLGKIKLTFKSFFEPKNTKIKTVE